MKRSEINWLLLSADEFIRERGFYLPPFAYFSPEKWRSLDSSWDEVRDNMLGWDVTDYGLGEFYKTGLILFTIRNGNLKNSRYLKRYAEKLLISEPYQLCPNHFHFSKMEDIINRGGGSLVMRLWQAEEDGSLSDRSFEIVTDGCRKRIKAGENISLKPGESITLFPYQYHEFWAEGGRCLIGEVSSVNDDNTDNRFYRELGRFPAIEEDEPPVYLLCNEYPEAKTWI
jgi:D-lyxose ketol-isomerase